MNCHLSWVFTDETLERKLFYIACPSCKKKVSDESGGYYCLNCQKSYENATPTYNFTIKISDPSGTLTCNILGDVGDSILGMPCKELYEIHQDVEALKNVRSDQSFKPFNVTLRAKCDMNSMGGSQGDSSVRFTVIRVTPHSF